MMKLIHIRKNEVNSNLSDNYQIAAAVLNGFDAALGFAALQSKEHRVLSVKREKIKHQNRGICTDIVPRRR